MVDLIEPMPKLPTRSRQGAKLGPNDELIAAEVEGLEWLQNAPQIDTILLDEKGFPLRMATPDPRAFALHKLWLSERRDRDPLKAFRDLQQARAVAQLVATYLPALSFEDDDLSALPAALRVRAAELLTDPADEHQADWE